MIRPLPRRREAAAAPSRAPAAAPDAAARRAREIRELNARVWDMVDNLVHPAALYVLFQVVIVSHLGRAPVLADLGPFHPASLAVYGLQFLGAWAVFYTTLLRDMGYRCAPGTVLLVLALLGTVAQYLLVPRPAAAPAAPVLALLLLQLVPAAAGWLLVMATWARRRREAPPPPAEEDP